MPSLKNGLYEKLGALSTYLVAWNGPKPNSLGMKTYLMVLGKRWTSPLTIQ
jgi:hypothetical protein